MQTESHQSRVSILNVQTPVSRSFGDSWPLVIGPSLFFWQLNNHEDNSSKTRAALCCQTPNMDAVFPLDVSWNVRPISKKGVGSESSMTSALFNEPTGECYFLDSWCDGYSLKLIVIIPLKYRIMHTLIKWGSLFLMIWSVFGFGHFCHKWTIETFIWSVMIFFIKLPSWNEQVQSETNWNINICRSPVRLLSGGKRSLVKSCV